ncbi:MAG: sensor histidine kinase [Spirochaetes bacterium]|nr:sensor histidine kinase [Spirochaetota bacterium]MBU0954658.1 sensor histidine kinase [Spirochaetota bacterium]
MKVHINRSALRIAGLYLLIATLWILLSDRILVFLTGDISQLAIFQTFKGIFFVAATGALLYFYSKKRIGILMEVQSRQEQAALQSLQEKEILLREVHHRVKNNMQLILSLMNIKETSATAINDVRNSIVSMSFVHNLLYQNPDLAAISASDFASGLATLIQDMNFDQNVRLSGSAADIPLTATAAIPLGIFVMEACDNALHHARKTTDTTLEILIKLEKSAGRLRLTIQDNGAGLAPDRTFKSGTAIMQAIATQVNGRMLCDFAATGNDGRQFGTLVLLDCPLPNDTPTV